MVKTRRTTLGSVNNRRSTMAPAPIPSEAKSKPRTRKSMAPRIAGPSEAAQFKASLSPPRVKNRRMTLSGTDNRIPTTTRTASNRTSLAPPPATTLKSDPRPVNDKKFINSCIRKLHVYLTESGYENPVRLKDLTRPSAKDFHNFVTYLLQRIDPTFPNATKKIEDEIALAFKSLGYPFNISKTALVAAGSTHTWPTLLLALTWLIELLECMDGDAFDDENEESERDGILSAGPPGQPLQDLEELEQRTEKVFVKYVEGAYVSFLAGDDEQSAKLEEDLMMYLEKDNEVIETEIEGVLEENAAITESINEFGKEIEDLPQRQTRLEELATDIEKFHELVRQLNEQKTARTQKVAEHTAELKQKEEQLQEKEANVNRLQNIIDTQDLSVGDVRELTVEHTQLQAEIDKVSRVKKGHDEETFKNYADLKKSFAKLEALSSAGFNAKVGKLDLMDEYGRKPKTNIELYIDRAHEEKQSRMLGGVDLKSGVIPLLSARKDRGNKQLSESRVELLKATDTIESSHATATETTDAMKALEKQIQRAEGDFKRVTEEHESVYEVEVKELKLIEDKVDALRNPVSLEAAVTRCQRRCAELEAQRKRYQDENLMHKHAVLAEINNTLRTCAEYREYQDNTIKKVKDSIGACDIPKITLTNSDMEKLDFI